MALLTIADLELQRNDLAIYLSRARTLKAIYDEYMRTSDERDFSYTVESFGSKTRTAGIHASESSGCQRAPVYSLMNVERKTAPKLNLNMINRFAIGKAVHAMVQAQWHDIARLSNGTLLFEDEVKVGPHLQEIAAQWDLHSACDGVITLLDMNGEPFLRVGLEIKTESDGQFKELKEPRDKHREQTNIYMAALDLPLMWTFYYNKSDSNVTDSTHPWLFAFDKKLWEDVQEMKFATWQVMAERGEIPEREEGFECGWCSFAWTCQPPKLMREFGKKAVPIKSGMRWKGKKP